MGRCTNPQGTIRALAFVCNPNAFGYVSDLTPKEIAFQIAPAVGMFGSMEDYVLNTATHLEEMGIQDGVVWEMQNLVADELERFP